MDEIEYKIIKPDSSLSDFVEGFWMIANLSEEPKEIVVLPNATIDLSLSCSLSDPFHIMLMGLESEAEQTSLSPKMVIFAISFKLPAIEYLLKTSIADLVNEARQLPADFWGFSEDDLSDFDRFYIKAANKLKELIKGKIDDRKQKLFELIYTSNGSITVKELSEKVYWSSRQINRYFNQQFGIPLKLYCNLLRFSASFHQLIDGRLFPEQNYTDQAHFIREIKKFSGVAPGELSKNKNDRFIQLSALKKQ
ncbi:MAG: AraC family transcriptional regulator [Candidatus Pedobacter colombiensis]|uniref:AraC family transcriptional regulator n=1 Tax=Candidatus Pedobacter colombiensis TaxID=3121371 RepID=A0AAJ5WCB8_9SPHI|nr:AraC family transcriptional regulator [Pedobacter sp.]WEK21041.1 MAG: AraC family transcriptional regulator [Pedobacter sp.]